MRYFEIIGRGKPSGIEPAIMPAKTRDGLPGTEPAEPIAKPGRGHRPC